MYQFGGTSGFNPFNGAHGAVANGGNINFRLGLPVEQNENLTMENAHLHFWFYVSNPAALQCAGFDNVHFLEVTSSAYDANEVNFELPLFVPDLKAGWNEVDLPFTAANNPNNTNGPFDITKVSFIRFVCPVESGGEYVAFEVRDLFAYAAEAPVEIAIDGDFADWAGVKDKLTSEKETPVYMEFKVWNDDENIYFYTKRDKASSIWANGAYIYYDLDTDNNPETGVAKEIPGLETWLYFRPFGGSAEAPAIATAWNGEASSSEIPTAFQFKGKISDDFVEIEASLPLSVAGVTKGSTIGVYSWSNKSGDDLKAMNLQYTVK